MQQSQGEIDNMIDEDGDQRPGLVDEESDEEDVIDNVETDTESDAESDMEDTTLMANHDTTALTATLSKFARDIREPSRIENAAMAVTEAARMLSAMGDDHGKIDTAVDNDCPIQLGSITSYSASLNTIIPVKVEGISVVQKPDEWVEIEITVDSGACITVMPRLWCQGISILQNSLSRAGTKYEVANGAHIKNLGERRCEMMTIGSEKSKLITFQVADVHKPLLSISGCADMGFDCYLGKAGGHLRDRDSGEMIPLERRENLYVMRAWVRQDPNVNVSQPFAGQA